MIYQDIKKVISTWLFPTAIVALLCLVSPVKADAALANYITSIEYVEITLGEGTATASANLTKSQTTGNCVPFVTMYFTAGTSPDNYDRKAADIYFEAGPKVTAERENTNGQLNLGIYIVEFDPSYVSVQQGTYSFATTSTTASITSVDQSKAAMVFYHKHISGNDKFDEGSADICYVSVNARIKNIYLAVHAEMPSFRRCNLADRGTGLILHRCHDFALTTL